MKKQEVITTRNVIMLESCVLGACTSRQAYTKRRQSVAEKASQHAVISNTVLSKYTRGSECGYLSVLSFVFEAL